MTLKIFPVDKDGKKAVFDDLADVTKVTIASSGLPTGAAKQLTLEGVADALGSKRDEALSGSLSASAISLLKTWRNSTVPVPSVSLVTIDFKNAVYAINGVSKLRSEVIEQNLDWGTFDATKIVPDVGLQIERTTAGLGRTKFVLTAAAASGMLPVNGGVTIIATYSIVTADPVLDTYAECQINFEALDLPDYGVEWETKLGYRNDVGNLSKVTDFTSSADTTVGVGTAHKAAFTFGSSRISVSVDGNTVATIAAVDNSTATHIGVSAFANLFDELAMSAVVTLEKLEFVTIVDDTALPALSTS